MSVHKKLMAARIKLQNTEMKKSGLNKFAGYSYFELGDFVPKIQEIFNDLGLCGVVSFTHSHAELVITDVEDGTVIVISSPMAEANLKGAHPIQNLGAVESYQRRYLWMTALEIVEHDVIDSAPAAEPKPAPKPEPVKKAPIPAVMAGKDTNDWYLKVDKEPGESVASWVQAVVDVTNMGLEETNSEAQVMKLFNNNRVIFDRLKIEDEANYKPLMKAFKTRIETLKGTV